MLRLYYSPVACSLASHIALEEAGAEYEAIEVFARRGDTQSPEFLAVNPKGFVPVLITDRGTISESTAILTYIAQSFPNAHLLPSDDPFGVAQVTSFNAFLATAVHIAYRTISRPRIFADGEVAQAAMRAKAPEMLARYFGLVEDQLSDGRPWIHGDRYTTSDPYLFVYASYLSWGDRGNPADFPLVMAHRERVLARPATLAMENIEDPARYGQGQEVLPLDSDEVQQAMANASADAEIHYGRARTVLT
jgi:glutathione S-transferase